jgi:hypothetical protein
LKRLAAGIAVLATALVAAPSASAQDVGYARALGPIHNQGSEARVHVRYSCDEGTHLWVSAKQSATGAKDPAVTQAGAGFGGAAATWWDSHRGSVICDGRTRQAWFSIDALEPGKRGQLVPGYAWLQFCVTSGETEETFALNVSLSRWVKVVNSA